MTTKRKTHKQAYHSRKYRRLIEWIADNDNNGDDEDIISLSGYLTTMMVANCYDIKPVLVARDVWMIRHPREASHDSPPTTDPQTV